MAEVRYLLWDLGGVLIPFSHEKLWRNFLGILPLRVSLSWFWRRGKLQSALAEPLRGFETGLISFADLKAAVERVLGVRLEEEKFRLAWNDIFGETGETAEYAAALRKKYPSYVLTNTNIEHLEFVKAKAPALSFVDGFLPSFELHALKPEEKFYRLALERIGARPEECLFIDDRPENVEGALKAGIPSLLYRGLPELKDELNGKV